MGQKLPFSRIFGGAPAKKEAAPVDPGSYVPPNMDGTPANRGGAAPPGAPAQARIHQPSEVNVEFRLDLEEFCSLSRACG